MNLRSSNFKLWDEHSCITFDYCDIRSIGWDIAKWISNMHVANFLNKKSDIPLCVVFRFVSAVDIIFKKSHFAKDCCSLFLVCCTGKGLSKNTAQTQRERESVHSVHSVHTCACENSRPNPERRATRDIRPTDES